MLFLLLLFCRVLLIHVCHLKLILYINIIKTNLNIEHALHTVQLLDAAILVLGLNLLLLPIKHIVGAISVISTLCHHIIHRLIRPFYFVELLHNYEDEILVQSELFV
jgi:hypothetical protein